MAAKSGPVVKAAAPSKPPAPSVSTAELPGDAGTESTLNNEDAEQEAAQSMGLALQLSQDASMDNPSKSKIATELAESNVAKRATLAAKNPIALSNGFGALEDGRSN